jgi:hypothetical protein
MAETENTTTADPRQAPTYRTYAQIGQETAFVLRWVDGVVLRLRLGWQETRGT